MLIDNSYFFGEIHIAQKGQSTVRNRIDAFIAKYEPQYLEEALGYAFSKAFNEGLTADVVDERWTKLLEGDEYTNVNGKLQKWKGFVNADNVSPIANYIYYWFTRDGASATTASGEKEDSEQGGSNVSGGIKQARAWNEMVAMNSVLYDFLLNKKAEDNTRLYPEFDMPCEKERLQPINFFNL